MPVQAVPTTIVVDRSGHVADRSVGQLDAPTLQRMLTDAGSP
jgi:hypothetical protein